MNKKTKGFTLAEVMISITIIGVIMMFYIPVHRTIANQYTTIGYAVFDNLNLITKELMLNQKLTINSESTDSTVSFGSQRILNTDDSILCKHIVNIVNSVGTPKCEAGDLYNVSGSSPIDMKIASINFNQPNFYTTNGHRYYLSKRQDVNNNVSTLYGYRLIGVDVNGKKGPNVDAPAGSKPADLIYFMILDNGHVLPLGAAATNRNYINTRVKGYYYNNIPDGVQHASGCKGPTEKCGYVNGVETCTPVTGKNPGECPFGVALINDESSTELTNPYKTSYCLTYGDSNEFKGYNCGASYPNIKCPENKTASTNKADECVLEIVKPIYRVKI